MLGYNTHGIDGVFGPGTRSAIEDWQKEQHLAGTGLNADQTRLLTALAEARTAELSAAAERARQEEEAADAAFWRTTGANGKATDLRSYLGRYPDGIYAEEARADLDRLEKAARAEARKEDRAAWEVAEKRNSVSTYRRYLDAYPKGLLPIRRGPGPNGDARPGSRQSGGGCCRRGDGSGPGSRALIEGAAGGDGL